MAIADEIEVVRCTDPEAADKSSRGKKDIDCEARQRGKMVGGKASVIDQEKSEYVGGNEVYITGTIQQNRLLTPNTKINWKENAKQPGRKKLKQ